MIKWLMKKLGYVNCRMCKKYTRPSIIMGRICSYDCLHLEQLKEGLNGSRNR